MNIRHVKITFMVLTGSSFASVWFTYFPKFSTRGKILAYLFCLLLAYLLTNFSLPDVREKLMHKSRILFLQGYISADYAQVLIEDLLIMDLKSSKDVTLYINSRGGEAIAGRAIHDCIASLNCKVNGFVVGECKSAAITVLQSCKNRLSSPHSQFLIHHEWQNVKLTSMGIDGLQETIKMLSSDDAEEVQILKKRTGKSTEEISLAMEMGTKFNFSMTAQQAKDFGLIDGVSKKPYALSVLVP